MNEFNQYNNLAIMAAIQEFYEQRAAAKAARTQAQVTEVQVSTAAANPSRIATAISTVRKIATTPLPLPWRRAAA